MADNSHYKKGWRRDTSGNHIKLIDGHTYIVAEILKDCEYAFFSDGELVLDAIGTFAEAQRQCHELAEFRRESSTGAPKGNQ